LKLAGLSGFLRRVGGPRAISLTAWAALSPVAILGPIFSFSAEAVAGSWPVLIFISALSYLPSGLLFLLASKTYLKPTPGSSKPVAALITFFLGGAGTGLLLALFSGVFGVEASPDYLGRTLGRGWIGLFWSSIIALVLDSRFEYAEARTKLRQSILENQRIIKERASIVGTLRIELVEVIRSTLTQLLQNPSPQQLNRLADDVIRPLSKSIRERGVKFDPKPRLEPEKFSQGPVLRGSFSNPSKSWLLPIAAAGVAITTAIRALNALALLNLLAFVLIWATTAWLQRRIQARGPWLVALVWIAGFVSHAGLAASLQNLVGGADMLLFSSNTGSWVLAFFLNFQLTLEASRKESLRALERELEAMDWQRKKLQQEVWGETRTLAKYVHGDIQGQIRAAALRTQPLSGEELEDLRTACLEALDERPAALSLESFFTQSRELWAGVMTIETDISPEVEDATEQDPFAKDALIEVTRECMINAVRHGQTNSISISTKLQTSEAGAFVFLEAKNIGHKLPEALETGFGSELFNDATSSWTRENWDEGVVVSAQIPVTD